MMDLAVVDERLLRPSSTDDSRPTYIDISNSSSRTRMPLRIITMDERYSWGTGGNGPTQMKRTVTLSSRQRQRMSELANDLKRREELSNKKKKALVDTFKERESQIDSSASLLLLLL